MTGMKGVVYVAMLVGAGFVGHYIGYHRATDSEFRVVREGPEVVLESMSLDKQHPLTILGQDFYLGDADHNFEGGKALARIEIMNDKGSIDAKVNSGKRGESL